MFSAFMLPGLLLAIGITGMVWWILKEFTNLTSRRVDGLAIVCGLGITFLLSLFNRGLLQDPLQIVMGISVLCLSYALVQWSNGKSVKYKAKKSK